MTIAVIMPAAELAISARKLIQMTGGGMGAVLTIGSTMETIGWAIVNSPYILFAVAIDGSQAKEWADGAFAAVIVFILINVITETLFGISSADLDDSVVATRTLLGREIPVSGYFASVLGAPASNIGVFVGIISGFAGGVIYNECYNYRKLPDALAFFNGKHFVLMVIVLRSAIISLALSIVWPMVRAGTNSFDVWTTNSSSTSLALAPFIYGALERLPLPLDLYHMLTIPMNYASFGGTYIVLTGANAGSRVFGQDPLRLTWATDLINLKDAGDITEHQSLMTAVAPARFKAGQMIGATGLLLGIALTMYCRVGPDKRRNYRSMFISTVLVVFLTGITEPLKSIFMFCVSPLYLVYAMLQGCVLATAGPIHLRLHPFGNLEFLTRAPMFVRTGLGGDLVNFILCVVVFFAAGYAIAYFIIGGFHFATPSRLGNYTDDSVPESGQGQTGSRSSGNSQIERTISLLGDGNNITLANVCTTRLRITVKDVDRVAELPQWKVEGATRLTKKDGGTQVIYGPKADVLESDINGILQTGRCH